MQAVQEKFRLAKIKFPNGDPKYKILSSADIIQKEIHKLAIGIFEVIADISILDCQKLLYEFKWNNNRLLEKYAEANSFNDFLKVYKIDLTVPLPSQMMVDSFIQTNELYKWCPNKRNGCKKAIKIDNSDVKDIICECGLTYCFDCEATPHSPFPCVLVQEWAAQLHDFERIIQDNNVICPYCYEFYDAQHEELFCIRCDNMFLKSNNRLFVSFYPEYENYLTLSERLEKIRLKKEALIGVQGVEFISTICEIVENLLQRILPLPIFSFYLDKDYLRRNAPTINNVSMYEHNHTEFALRFDKLLDMIDSKFDFRTFLVSKDNEYDILNLLHSVQMHFNVLFDFITETNGWIFKLPEIQEAYDRGDDDEEFVENSVDEEYDDDFADESSGDEDDDI